MLQYTTPATVGAGYGKAGSSVVEVFIAKESEQVCRPFIIFR